MKLTSKRLAALLLAAIMVLSVFAGCSKPADPTEPKETQKPGETQTTEGGEPSGETVKLTALCNAGNTMTLEPDEMPSFQNLEAETGIDVEWEFLRTGWDERKNLVLADADLPDMFFGNRTLKVNDIVKNAELFTDLTPYLDQMPNIQKMFEEEPAMKNVCTMEDGRMLFLPARMPCRPQTFDTMYINQKWLDTLNLEIPTTTDEFVEVMRAFKNDDPNGNGIADEIPITGNGTGTGFNPLWILLGAFGLDYNVASPGGENVMIENGKPIFIAADERYKEGIIWLHSLFEEGLIDQEFFTQDWGMSSAKKFSTDPMLVGLGVDWSINAGVGMESDEFYTELPPLKGPHGDQVYPSNPAALSIIPCAWSLSDSCENKEAACRWINAMYDPEVSVQFYFGSYGTCITKNDDGTVTIGESGNPEMDIDSWIWTNTFGDMGPYYISKEFEKKLIPNSWVNDRLGHDAMFKEYARDPADIYPMVFYTPEDTEELSVLKTDVWNLVNQKFAQWISGENDINAEWDTYLKDLESIGLSRLMEIYNKYWEASKG